MTVTEHSGVFWLPEHADKTISGTLVFPPGETPRLKLIGSLQASGKFGTPFEPEIILGVTATGDHVTLHRCTEVSSKLAAFMSSELEATVVLVGRHFESTTNLAFHKMAVSYDQLSSWARITGFGASETMGPSGSMKRIEISYEFPEDATAVVKGLTIKLPVELSLTGDRIAQVHLDQKIYFEVEAPQPIPLVSFIDDVFYHIQNFLALGVGVPVHPVSIKAYPTQTGEKNQQSLAVHAGVEIYYAARRASAKDRVHPLWMLFRLADIREFYPKCLNAWFEKADVLKPVYDLYFSSLYAPSMYLQTHFLSLAQAVESYHRRTRSGAYLPEKRFLSLQRALKGVFRRKRFALSEPVLAAFDNRLAYFNEVSLRRRLQDLLATLGSLPTLFISHPDKFTDLVVTTRNYLTHYDAKLAAGSASGIRLYGLVQQLRFLLEMCFLREIGLPDTVIKSLAEHNQNYVQLRNLLSGL